MSQTPSVNPDESKVTEPELSMPEITSGNSQGVPVNSQGVPIDNNPSVFRAAKTIFKIEKLHAIIGFVAIGAVLQAIIIGVLFSEISSLKDQLSEKKAKDIKTKATIAALETDLKANKATIASLDSQMKPKDNKIMKSVNHVNHFEVERHVYCGDGGDGDYWKWNCPLSPRGWRSTRCTKLITIHFNQSYDTPPLVAVMLDLRDDFEVLNYWSLRVTSVEKSKFTVACGKSDNGVKNMYFNWISFPNITSFNI